MTDFRVVPAALRKAVTEIDEATANWAGSRAHLEDQFMDGDTLGLLGRSKAVHDTYNVALKNILDQLDLGRERLAAATNSLNEVAKHYEAMNASAYRRFGYLDERPGR
jgi:hypothetical protein